MFLRYTKRKKDGKEHRYWSIVENRRIGGGRVVQRPLLYLGEINDSQELAWRKSIAILEEGALQPRTLSLFPEDRCEGLLPDASIVRLRLNELRLCRPRQWGGCWLALSLWRELELDRFWGGRLPPSRKGTRWDRVLLLLATYRLLAPGSEWRLHREWFERSAMADLLGEDLGLAEMRGADPPVQYLVGTPKGRLTRLEKDLLAKPWQQARPGVRVKLLPRDGELYVFADSASRVAKERAMRRRQLKWLWARLKQLSMMTLSREELLMKLGAARAHAPAAWRLVVIAVAPEGVTFTYHLDRNRLRRVRRREGRYLLRTNLTEDDPAKLWNLYLLLVRVEEAFKNLKGDLAIRPIFHQDQARIEAHIFIAFLAYCLHATL